MIFPNFSSFCNLLLSFPASSSNVKIKNLNIAKMRPESLLGLDLGHRSRFINISISRPFTIHLALFSPSPLLTLPKTPPSTPPLTLESIPHVHSPLTKDNPTLKIEQARHSSFKFLTSSTYTLRCMHKQYCTVHIYHINVNRKR